jgi:acetyltransferase
MASGASYIQHVVAETEAKQSDTNHVSVEFSILVRSDLKGEGLGSVLMRKMIRYCRERGTTEMVGQVLADNADMLRLARHLGFTSRRGPDHDVVEVRLVLNEGRLSDDASAVLR